MKKRILGIIILPMLMVLSSCASIPPKAADMVPMLDNNYAKTDKSLWVYPTLGGGKTDFGQSRLENEGFTNALIITLRNSNLFSEINTGRNADYELSAAILFDSTGQSFNMTAILIIEYTISQGGSGIKIFQKPIRTEYTATFADASQAKVRQRMAIEGAAKENLRLLLKELAQIVDRNK